MGELDDILRDAGRALRNRAGEVSDTEQALAALRKTDRIGDGRSPRRLRAALALTTAAAAILVAVVIARGGDDGGGQVLAPAPSAMSTVPPVALDGEAVQVTSHGGDGSATSSSVAPTVGPTTSAAPSVTTGPASPSSGPVAGADVPCIDAASTTEPVNVGRALSCPDGTEVWVTGVVLHDDDGNPVLCAMFPDPGKGPCPAEALRLVDYDGGVALRGVKEGNTLRVESSDGTAASPAMPPIVVAGPTDELEAFVTGLVRIDARCSFLVDPAGDSVPIVWPAGTTWDERRRMVVLADGQTIADGDSISGSGGGVNVGQLLGEAQLQQIEPCLAEGDSTAPSATEANAVIVFPKQVERPEPATPPSG